MKSNLSAAIACGFALTLATACGGGDDSSTVSADCEPAWTFDTVKDGILTIAAVQQLPSVDVAPNGEVAGIDSAILSDFAQQACLEIAWEPLAGSAAVAAMTEGKADIGAGGWYKTPERGEVVGQTVTTWYDAPALVSNDGFGSIDELKGEKVGVVGGALFEQPLKDALGESNVAVFQSIDAVLQDLESGRIAAGIGSGAVLSALVESRGSDEQVVAMAPDSQFPELTTAGEPNYPYTLGNAELGDALDEYIEQVREDGTLESALEDHGLEASYLQKPS